jgi:hypothetical protein
MVSLGAMPTLLPRRSPSDRARRILTGAAWVAAFLSCIALSWSIPLFSGTDPASGTLHHPRLHPVYFQSNEDAQLEIQTSLGFPGYFHEQPYRISRPTFYAALAGAREFLIEPAAVLLFGEAKVRWGNWSARETLITYFLWLLANAACVAGACLLAYHLLSERILPAQSGLAVFLLLSAPIVLLAMREIHLNAFQVLTSLACLAFWNSALRGRPRLPALAAQALLLGILFLGKPSLSLFGAGAFLALLLGRGRSLLLILPLVALPSLLWMAAMRALGYTWSVPEVTHWKAGVWILEAGWAGTLRELAIYVRDWAKVLQESLTPIHLLLAGFGAWSLRKGNTRDTVSPDLPSTSAGRRLLALAALLAAADFAFYFLVHRVHAAYYAGTLLGIFACAAVGAVRLADILASRLRPGSGPALRYATALVLLLLIQAMLLVRQLPRYPG